MAALVWLMLLALSSLANSAQTLPKSIFLLAGEGNMVGRGGLRNNKWDGFIPPECEPSRKIIRLSGSLKWEEARDPLHIDIDIKTHCGIGPGMPFANALSHWDKDVGVIGLVPCAVGGTKIDDWSQDSMLYSQLLARAQAALKAGSGEIKAMLWYQGEADTEDPADAKAYKQKLEKFFTDFRSDLNMPTLPIYQVALASAVNPEQMDLVRKAQLEIKLPNLKTVDALGLPLNGDELHLSVEGQVLLGKKLADAFM